MKFSIMMQDEFIDYIISHQSDGLKTLCRSEESFDLFKDWFEKNVKRIPILKNTVENVEYIKVNAKANIKSQECFLNSFKTAILFDEYQYSEGFILKQDDVNYLPVPHATNFLNDQLKDFTLYNYPKPPLCYCIIDIPKHILTDAIQKFNWDINSRTSPACFIRAFFFSEKMEERYLKKESQYYCNI